MILLWGGMEICKSVSLENVHKVKEILGRENRPKGGTSGKLQMKNKSLQAQRRSVPYREDLGSFMSLSFKTTPIQALIASEVHLPPVTTTSVWTHTVGA